MPDPVYSHLDPELGPPEVDPRSIHAFWHGFPSPLVRWHFHHEFELHLIVASEGKVFVGDHVGEFSPGHLVLMGPRLPHNWISQTQAGDTVEMRDGVIQFRENLVQSMAAFAPELKRVLPMLDRARHGIEFRDSLCAEAVKWFEDLISSDGLRRIGLLFEILERLSREREYRTLSTAPLSSGRNIALVSKLERAMNHIKEHHDSSMKMDSVAELIGMSNSSFSHYFTKSTGGSFTQFLNNVRITHACELLSTTESQITDICYTVGFNNVANFNRRFRMIKGMTPREYRKRILVGHC
ncbi:AraC family transcriptional regulator [Granulosicoccus antarcticus]|uniref:HTH-type transcriptional activator Btr n=1 Tax=Granulosicoccus antarcticus IMCC3135 TaxID=1192854 RepID=A0A2Z2P214_9GAMM|nr:AraC family transcriptional regulator [Granulosicoccus antarcticus]ASJ73674.1 HTH-type transcriptional activator Btr [Granulosicoccus antarcticus IMCC3135]